MSIRRVRIIATVSIRRTNPTPAEAARDAATQTLIQKYLDIDMEDRVRKLETLLNTDGATL